MLEELAKTPISQIQLREPVRALETEPLFDVAVMMNMKRRGSVIVENSDGKLVGIFTERDFVARVDHSSDLWKTRPVKEFMTKEIETITPEKSVRVALGLMQKGGFRHLPVVDSERNVVGFLSIRDLLTHVAENFPKEFVNLPPAPSYEARHEWGG